MLPDTFLEGLIVGTLVGAVLGVISTYEGTTDAVTAVEVKLTRLSSRIRVDVKLPLLTELVITKDVKPIEVIPVMTV